MKRIVHLMVAFCLVMAFSIVTVVSYSFGEVKKKGKKQLPQPPVPAQVAIEKEDALSKMGNAPNAKLMKFYFDSYNKIQLLIPDNISDYQYLNHYPLSAFLFVTLYDQQKIANLNVKDIMNGHLGRWDFYDILSFDRIKGFEDIATEIKKLDEFGVAARKNEIISKLIDCYKTYYKDYERYLKGMNGYYIFKNPTEEDRYTWPMLPEYRKVKSIPTTNFMHEISRDKYNFDRGLIEIITFGHYRLNYNDSWEYGYMSKFYDIYKNSKKVDPRFPKSISIPMSIDNARKLFGDQQKAFCETLFTVKPVYGLFGKFSTLTYKVSNFDIYKITKKCYREDTGFNDPVLIFEFESTKDKPFH